MEVIYIILITVMALCGAANGNEEQKGKLRDHLPRNGDGRYSGRYNNGKTSYRIYDAEIFTGSADSLAFRNWRMDFRERSLHDFNYDLRRKTMTTAPVGLKVAIALIKNQPTMHDDVKQIIIEDLKELWSDYKQGGRRRSRRGVE